MVNNFQGNVKVGWFLVNIKQLEINLLVGRIDTLGIKCWELNSFFFFSISVIKRILLSEKVRFQEVRLMTSMRITMKD